jgi:ABC-2 type transport system permease protein
VNLEHLKAFVWLRWRLRVNQMRKAGTVNAVLIAIVQGFALLASVGLFVLGLVLGLLALPHAPPWAHLFMWDGIVVGFLFWWMIGLVADLQRAEALSLDRFLHMPVSLSGAFLVNYVSSLFSLTLRVLVPGMVGLVIGMAVSIGPRMLLVLFPMAAFVFALTAVTYQFQGWLASMMANPRRRRTVIVLVTAGFILIAQTPNLINVIRPWEGQNEPFDRQTERLNDLGKEAAATKMPPAEYLRRQQEIFQQTKDEQEERSRQKLERAVETTRLINLVLPPGWFPLGAEGVADGKVLPPLLGTLGLGLIGTVSLWRAYRTTLRLYTGTYTGSDRKVTETTPTAPPLPADPNRVYFLERRLPWVSEQTAAVALAGFRSLLRAPEAKMAFLAPIMMLVVAGGVFVSGQLTPPDALRPFLVLGTAVMVLLVTGGQLIGNQFGYDRGGFRAYVLSPLPRRDILLGKNLAVAPVAIGLALVTVAVVGAVFPMRVDHYFAVVAQLLAAYLIFCLLANLLSIAGPIPLASGSLQPAQVKAVPVLLQMVFLMVAPVALVPVFAPYGLEAILAEMKIIEGVPISLPLSLVVLLLVGLLYRAAIGWEAGWLANREQRILEVVTAKAE